MRPDALDLASSAGDGPLDRLDPRAKLAATGLYVAAVVATPPTWPIALVVEAILLAVVVGISGLEILPLLRRWLGFAVLVAFLAAMVAMGHRDRPALGWPRVAGSILLKNSLAFLAVLVLAGVTPFPRLLDALRRLGAPRVLVATLHFMFRYSYVLVDELGRMVQARRSRSFRRGGPGWASLSGLIGVLFLRAMERGERVHSAMLARGWDGTIRSLDDGADAP